jgi:hypothetical protein
MLGGAGPVVQTWTWDGRWHPVRVATGPDAIEEPSVLADMPPLHGAVLLSPQDAGAGSWLWSHGSWHVLDRPPWDADWAPVAAAYDPLRRRLVVLIGSTRDGDPSPRPAQAWTWDGAGWLRVPDLPVDSLAGTAMAWDADLGAVVVAQIVGPSSMQPITPGENTPMTSWAWNGTSWHVLSRDSVPAGWVLHGLGWDDAHHALLLLREYQVGGAAPQRETLRLTAAGWRTTGAAHWIALADATISRPHRPLLVLGAEMITDGPEPQGSDTEHVYAWTGTDWTIAAS